MIFFSSFMLLIRCTTIVLLGLIKMRWAILYVFADLVLYLGVKIARRDYWYWAPLSGVAMVLTSFFARIISKVIADFTSIVQFRHPNEVGGAYWLFGSVSTMVSLPAAIYFFEANGGNAETAKLAKLEASVLLPSVVIVFSIFFKNINKRYRRTFFSLERGKDMTIEKFRNSEDDGKKASADFKKNKKHWESIELEVRAFVSANWKKWVLSNPKWLTHNLRSNIPLEFIPNNRDRLQERVRRMTSYEASRRGSLGNTSKREPAGGVPSIRGSLSRPKFSLGSFRAPKLSALSAFNSPSGRGQRVLPINGIMDPSEEEVEESDHFHGD